MTIEMINRINYFITSAIFGGTKTIWYSFTLPSSLRKIFEKDDSYRSHIDNLIQIIEETGKDKSLIKYIYLGDGAGFFAGVSAVVFYATRAL